MLIMGQAASACSNTLCLNASLPGSPCLRADAVPVFSLIVPLLKDCLHHDVTSTASDDHSCGGGVEGQERPDRGVGTHLRPSASPSGEGVHMCGGRERASVCCPIEHCEVRPKAKKPDVDDKEGAFVGHMEGSILSAQRLPTQDAVSVIV